MGDTHRAGVVPPSGDSKDRHYLDSGQLDLLEQSFRAWAQDTPRADLRVSRTRILLVFLLIRYTGAKLNEVLALDPSRDVDHARRTVLFRNSEQGAGQRAREVVISEKLSGEIRSLLAGREFRESPRETLGVDPGFVRRKFYERAAECGFPKELGGPETIRKSRAVELLQSNIPLPAVQMLLGHSTPNLTSSYVTFSEDDMRDVTKHFVERESSRKTSARNSFFGKIIALHRGDIQTLVEISTVEGHRITTLITNDSAGRLGLKEGRLVTAEVKAPWVVLQKGEHEPECSAENRFGGVIEQVNEGAVNTEYVVSVSEGTKLCSVVTTGSARRLGLAKGDVVWSLFNCYAVVLHSD